MADSEEGKLFFVEYAAQGRAKCKKCKEQIVKGSCRIGKAVSNPFSDDGGTMKHWFHVTCIFDSFARARATTKKIEKADDLDGFDALEDEDKSKIRGLIRGMYPMSPVKMTRITTLISIDSFRIIHYYDVTASE